MVLGLGHSKIALTFSKSILVSSAKMKNPGTPKFLAGNYISSGLHKVDVFSMHPI
jgi:hypothetical protein